jgi:hypothetical protein
MEKEKETTFKKIKNEMRINYKNLSNLRKIYIIVFILLLITAVILSIINPLNYFTKPVNVSMYVSLILLFLFFITSSYYKEKNVINVELQKIYNLRQNVFGVSLFFIILIVNILILNPYDIEKTYKIILIVLLNICILLSLYVFFSFSNILDISDRNITLSTALWNTIYKSFGLLLGLSFTFLIFFVLITFLLKVFNQSSNETRTIIEKIMIYIFIIILIGLIFKYVILKYLESLNSTNGIVKITYIILKYLTLIPCFIIYLAEFLFDEYKITKKNDILFFIIISTIVVILIVYYYIIYPFLLKKYYSSDWDLILNKPVSLDKEKVVSTYLEIYKNPKINKNTQKYYNYYKYAISFWFYLDSYGPNKNASYTKDTIILNYGYNPFVTYNASKNMLKISLMDLELLKKCQTSNLNIDSCFDKISNVVYKNKNMKLQKWSNIVLVFNSGILDIFYNNTLVKSGIEVPNISSLYPLVVGSNNGLTGGICNILYLKKNFSLETMNKLYNSVKDKNPPIQDIKN